jgi:hypothetical protein
MSIAPCTSATQKGIEREIELKEEGKKIRRERGRL